MTNLVECIVAETIPIHPHRFVMELLQGHKDCKIGVDELRRPPVMALRKCEQSVVIK